MLHCNCLKAPSAFLWTLSLSAIKERRLPGAGRHEPRIKIAAPPRRGAGRSLAFECRAEALLTRTYTCAFADLWGSAPHAPALPICGAPRPTPRPLFLWSPKEKGRKENRWGGRPQTPGTLLPQASQVRNLSGADTFLFHPTGGIACYYSSCFDGLACTKAREIPPPALVLNRKERPALVREAGRTVGARGNPKGAALQYFGVSRSRPLGAFLSPISLGVQRNRAQVRDA